MGGPDPVLMNHLASGLTTVCRCWSILRTDGTEFGFTDHDCDLAFDGVTYRANTGLSALAVQQSTGLSVDNTEAIGALSDAAIRQEDIEAGRFDDDGLPRLHGQHHQLVHALGTDLRVRLTI